jgi:hypothetical protein
LRLHSGPPKAISATAASLARGEKPFGYNIDMKRWLMIASKLATEAADDLVEMIVLGREGCSCNCDTSAPMMTSG